jgi:hypothetical protein
MWQAARICLVPARLDQIEHLVALRKTFELVLGKNELAIEFHVEDAVLPLDELRSHLEFLLDTVRQPGGMRQVVSLHAILDADLQIDTSSELESWIVGAR